MHIPALRWGKPYKSLDVKPVEHFLTGEPMAELSQANGGLVQRDMRKSQQARDALREIPAIELIQRLNQAADLFETARLPIGDDSQDPVQFAQQQSASSGLPEAMCRANMAKSSFVLRNMGEILDCLSRGLPLEILTRGWGTEQRRGVTLSYQAQSPVLGAVLPSNSPGVHTLWLPAVALQIGLVLKPGSQEPWTPYRMIAALVEAGLPPQAFGLYPGGHDVGAAVISSCQRVMVFGGTQTVEQYKGNPRVQPHGPGFSKILLADDVVDDWEQYLDLMVESIYSNGGRSCINCSGVWASRHTGQIAEALAERLGPIEPLPPEAPEAGLAAFPAEGMGAAVWNMIEADLADGGTRHVTKSFGPRLVEHERCSYLRPTIVHCQSPEAAAANREYMFPYASVVKCAESEMLQNIGPTLVCTVITRQPELIRKVTDAPHIDRLNIGAIPTNRLNWLQPHEGNIIEFLFRSRAFQIADDIQL